MSATQIRAVTLLIIVFGCACLARARAQETTLTVRPLRDGGGLERGLNVRLTTALARFLTDHAAKSVRVSSENNSPPSPKAVAARYTLEGDLTFTNGADEQNSRFLLVTRLFRETTPKVLVGQWAGTADSLRSLTVNLRRDPRVHALGLVGELGSRIVTCLNADRRTVEAQWSRLLPQLSAETNPYQFVDADDTTRLLHSLEAGALFRLRVQRTVTNHAFLLLKASEGSLRLNRLSDTGEGWTVSKGKTELSRALILPEGTREAWVVTSPPAPLLVAQRARRGETVDWLSFLTSCPFEKWDALCCPATSNQSEIAPLLARCVARRGVGVRYYEDTPPVQILEGVGNQGSHSEPAPALKQLLDEIAHAPAAWRVQKLRIMETK